MKTLGNITVFTIIIVLTFLTALLEVHVLLSIASLYSLSFILQFSFVQIYGLFCILSILKYNYDGKINKKEEGEAWYVGGFKKIGTVTLNALLVWGIAFLAFNILN